MLGVFGFPRDAKISAKPLKGSRDGIFGFILLKIVFNERMTYFNLRKVFEMYSLTHEVPVLPSYRNQSICNHLWRRNKNIFLRYENLFVRINHHQYVLHNFKFVLPLITLDN